MKNIFEAIDGKQFDSKLICRNYEFKLEKLKEAVFKAFDANLFWEMKRPDRKTPIFNTVGFFKKNYSEKLHGFYIGYHYAIIFHLQKNKLKMIWKSSFDDGVYYKYLGTIYLDKIK